MKDAIIRRFYYVNASASKASEYMHEYMHKFRQITSFSFHSISLSFKPGHQERFIQPHYIAQGY
jgi:hypothetical protein